jgi:hypothetical protein
MPAQTKSEKPAVIGEDGELVQPDTSVDPEAYTEYLATHVHRDPLLFRIRKHFLENRIGYTLILWPFSCASIVIVPLIFMLTSNNVDWGVNRDAIMQGLLIAILVPVGLLVFIYLFLRVDRRE